SCPLRSARETRPGGPVQLARKAGPPQQRAQIASSPLPRPMLAGIPSWVLILWLAWWGHKNGKPMRFGLVPDDIGEPITVQVTDFNIALRRCLESQRGLRDEPASIRCAE